MNLFRRGMFALGIVADSPEAGEPASLPRTMSGKPDGELASRNAQKNKNTMTFMGTKGGMKNKSLLIFLSIFS